MQREAVGLIETVGLTAAIEAADTAVKSANVRLSGYELTRGSGMVTVKIEGAVGAVKAAVEAARASAAGVSQVYAVHVIPRPAQVVDSMIHSPETAGSETAAAEDDADRRAAIDETAPAVDAPGPDSQDDFSAADAADTETGEPETPAPQSPEDAADAAAQETTENTPKDGSGRKKNKGLKKQEIDAAHLRETVAKAATEFETRPS